MANYKDFTAEDLSSDPVNFLRTAANTALMGGEPQVEAGVKSLGHLLNGTPSQYDADKAIARYNTMLYADQNPNTALGASALGVVPWLFAGGAAPAIEGIPVVGSVASRLLTPTTPGQAAISGSAFGGLSSYLENGDPGKAAESATVGALGGTLLSRLPPRALVGGGLGYIASALAGSPVAAGATLGATIPYIFGSPRGLSALGSMVGKVPLLSDIGDSLHSLGANNKASSELLKEALEYAPRGSSGNDAVDNLTRILNKYGPNSSPADVFPNAVEAAGKYDHRGTESPLYQSNSKAQADTSNWGVKTMSDAAHLPDNHVSDLDIQNLLSGNSSNSALTQAALNRRSAEAGPLYSIADAAPISAAGKAALEEIAQHSFYQKYINPILEQYKTTKSAYDLSRRLDPSLPVDAQLENYLVKSKKVPALDDVGNPIVDPNGDPVSTSVLIPETGKAFDYVRKNLNNSYQALKDTDPSKAAYVKDNMGVFDDLFSHIAPEYQAARSSFRDKSELLNNINVGANDIPKMTAGEVVHLLSDKKVTPDNAAVMMHAFINNIADQMSTNVHNSTASFNALDQTKLKLLADRTGVPISELDAVNDKLLNNMAMINRISNVIGRTRNVDPTGQSDAVKGLVQTVNDSRAAAANGWLGYVKSKINDATWYAPELGNKLALTGSDAADMMHNLSKRADLTDTLTTLPTAVISGTITNAASESLNKDHWKNKGYNTEKYMQDSQGNPYNRLQF